MLLPGELEGFALEAHARELLAIPRVIALEPGRVRTPRFMRDSAAVRQARKLHFPGSLRVVILYHPAQYPLARALYSRYEAAELWYVPPDPETRGGDDRDRGELASFDELARDRATATLEVLPDGTVDDEPLRLRLRELEVINPRAFVAGVRFRSRQR